jgi:sugar-specific transcriptional regulator TrmB
MAITDRVTLFGYSALEAEQYVAKLKEEFESKQRELEESISLLKSEISDIKEQIEHNKKNRQIVVKKRPVRSASSAGAEENAIMKSLYDAHIKATEKVGKIQKNISITLEKRRSLILIREKKAKEMKSDLQNLIDYIDSIAKEY